MDEKLMTPKEIADKLGVTDRWIRKLCNAGKIPHRRLGGKFFLVWSEVFDSMQSVSCSLTIEKNREARGVRGKDALWQ